MDHMIRAPAVPDHSIEHDREEDHHEGEHDRIALIEGILLYPVVKQSERHKEPEVENEHRVYFLPVVEQKVVPILQLEKLFLCRREDDL